MSWQTPKPKREQRVVIFDSPDGTGKTNIAQGLSMKLGIPYFRMATQHENWRTNSFVHALRFDQTLMVEMLRQAKMDLVVDRAYPAEFVYSQVYRRETDWKVLEQVDDAHAQLGTNIVIPLRHDYSKNRKDELVDNDMLPRLHDKYLEFSEWTRCSCVVIYVDDFKDDLKRELEVIEPELHFEQDLGFITKVELSRTERKFSFGNGRDRKKFSVEPLTEEDIKKLPKIKT